MKWYKKLHWQIILGLVLGLIWGLVSAVAGFNEFTLDFIKPFGTIFITLLKLIAVPLVLASLVAGVTSLNDTASLSRMGEDSSYLSLYYNFCNHYWLSFGKLMGAGKSTS